MLLIESKTVHTTLDKNRMYEKLRIRIGCKSPLTTSTDVLE